MLSSISHALTIVNQDWQTNIVVTIDFLTQEKDFLSPILEYTLKNPYS